MTPPPPLRPRLARHVLARRHLAQGEEIAVLHDTRTGGLVRLGAREWGLLAAADGTRDLEGIAIAAARAGAYARVPALRDFFAQLHAAGLLEEGRGEASEDECERSLASSPPPETPLDPLAGYALHCDGSGSCCRLYPSIVFSPLEALSARARLPLVRDGGTDPARLFTPERGSGPAPALAVAMQDGRCSFLEPSGACALHAAADAAAKPLGCRLYPATFTDDGEAVRVSVAVECACVLASVGRPGGEPLVAGSARTAADLPREAFVARVPDRVLVVDDATEPRAALVRFSRAALQTRFDDAAAAFQSLARHVATEGLTPISIFSRRVDEMGRARLRRHFESLAERSARRARDDASWRSEADLARRATQWIARAATALAADPDALDRAIAPRASAEEAFYLRAGMHGHALVGDLPLSRALEDRAARLVLARALDAAATSDRDEAVLRHPLALVEAMLRGHGLAAYAWDA